MKTRTTIIAGFVAASATFLGVAHAMGPGGCDGEGSMRGAMMRDGDMGAKMAQRAEKRMERFRTDLKVTAEQEPLWKAFADSAKAGMGKGMQAMRANVADTKLSAPERMEKMQAAMKERLATMEGVQDHFKRLYAALTPEQKAVADQHFQKMGHGNHKGREQGREGPRGPRAADPAKG